MSTTATILLISATASAAVVIGSVIVHKNKAGAVKNNIIEEKSGTEERAEYENAKAEFVKNSGAFIGIYEPLYRISIGRLKNAHGLFADWNVRVTYLADTKSLQKLWMREFSGIDSWSEEVYVAKSRKLMEILRSFGVERLCETDFSVNMNTYKRYSTLDGEIIEAGNKVKVISPCWLLNGDTLEKGLIDIEKQNGGQDNE